MPSIFDYSATLSNGIDTPLSDYKGQVLLVVNTASRCGFTPQYEGLEKLYNEYKDSGFSVLAFPCNQFGAQEPGSTADIVDFCTTRFQTTFPLFEKIDVNGSHLLNMCLLVIQSHAFDIVFLGGIEQKF